ncbi:MAG: DUF3489 domain-containing protein [Sphingopyxis sp.]|nr:DUF3489 domain-containing protein [Sphingopyxis sp.]
MTNDTKTNAPRAGSKAEGLLILLRRKEGASLEEMTTRTDWQAHSVRAAITGLKKQGHVIAKRVSGNTTVWFIAEGAAA